MHEKDRHVTVLRPSSSIASNTLMKIRRTFNDIDMINAATKQTWVLLGFAVVFHGDDDLECAGAR
jgi:hypothetical protein